MDAFATVDDYVTRYGDVDDEGLLEQILLDASRLIKSELNNSGISVDADDEDAADRRMQVCRAVAYRAMDQEHQSSIPFGATQFSQAAGGYSESFTIGNPYRDIYLTKAEKHLLGIGRGRFVVTIPGGTSDADY